MKSEGCSPAGRSGRGWWWVMGVILMIGVALFAREVWNTIRDMDNVAAEVRQ